MKLMIKHVLVVTACIFAMAAFAGCAGSNMGPGNTPEGVYNPKLPASIKTFEDARMDLAGLLENRQSNLDLYFGNNYFVQHNLRDLMLSEAGIKTIEEGAVAMNTMYNFGVSPQYPLDIETKTISVRESMLKESSRLFVRYEDLPDLPITVKSEAVFLGDRQVAIGGLNEEEAHRIADDLFFIQQNFKNLKKERERRRALFASLAAQYRGLAVKPPMQEEQRKYVVQANALSRLKDYYGAIALYLKAIDVNPVSYPGAYFNLALLNGQIKSYSAAIRYMKQYLLLAPEAGDARSAQDKIYEWEIMMKK
ncbi:MAG: hypothetical protein M0033_09720 [Nitrospiraceae bacterium]|nr:hypothetical protein [Nitrospiraceae bacterium]